ncbi:MAG: DUF523 domain-containing protein [Candidatus Gracilibacteria bacterium]|nr:DUF523 domain-containing protein [Candidatus Gracilibacteria bacterium]
MYIASSCLCGIECRYDGKSNINDDIIKLYKEGKIISVCPEELAGLGAPRTPIEIVGDKILDKNGNDYTEQINNGIEIAMDLVKNAVVEKAFLKSKSPTCGYGLIYDGTFSGNLVKGNGIFAQKLLDNSIDIQSCN